MLQAFLEENFKDKNIGFVPTMGALHKGHVSLIEQSIKNNDITVVSIFVNPTQFNNLDDLNKYPRTLETDLKILEEVNCDAVFIPSVKEIYPQKEPAIKFNFQGLEKVMEGKFRLGHFEGVGTVVKKLFEIVKPTHAYFGEKDFQQLLIIKKMISQLKMPVNIISCPIFREESGLAMSSRNARLSGPLRKEAHLIYKCLQKVKADFKKSTPSELSKFAAKTFHKKPFFKLEYFTIADAETLIQADKIDPNKNYRAFIAIFVDEVRLIDNIAL